MDTQTDPGDTREDQLGKQLAEQGTALPGAGPAPTNEDIQRGTQEAEDFANNPANATNPLSAAGPSSHLTPSVGGGAGKGGGRFGAAVRGLGRFAGRNKTKLGVGGALSGLVLALIFGFLSLLPLKLDSIIENIFQHTTMRMENYAERRADVVVYHYLIDMVGGSASDDPIYLNSSLLKTLYGNMQLNKYQQKLLDEKGIKIEKGSKKGTIKVTTADGATLDNADVPKLAKFLDGGDLKGKAARDAIRAFTQDTTKWYQYLKRRHLRRYMQNAYGIRKWSIPQRDDKDAKSTDADKPNPTESDIAEPTLEASEAADASAIDCILSGDNCPDEDHRQSPDGVSDASPHIADGDNSANEADLGDAKTAASDATKTSISDSFKEIRASSQAAIANGIEKTLTKVFGDAIGKAMSKAVPIVGWIAMASDIDNFMWNGHIRSVMIALHETQYATEAATWTSLDDQKKEGKLGGQQVNDALQMTNGAENSAAFRATYHTGTGGQGIDPSKAVGDVYGQALGPTGSLTCDATYFLQNFGSTPPTISVTNPDYWTWTYRELASAPTTATGFHTPLCLIHPVVSKLSGFVGDLVSGAFKIPSGIAGFILKHILGIDPDTLTAAVTNGMVWAMNHAFTPVATGFEVGASLFNNLYVGWDVITNNFIRDTLGGHIISDAVANQQLGEIDAEQTQELRQQGFFATFYNLDYTQSVASRVLAGFPTSLSSAFDQVGTTGLAVLSNPLRSFSFLQSLVPGASAADSLANFDGKQQYGFDDAELDDPNLHLATQDVAGPPDSSGKLTGPDGVINEYDCPVISDPTKVNMCLIDTAVVEAMDPNYTSDDDGGIANEAAPSAAQPTGGALPSGDAQELAKEILANPKIVKDGRLVMTDLQDTAAGKIGSSGAPLSSTLLALIVLIGQNHSIHISAIESGGTGHATTSRHYTGDAFDINYIDGVHTDGRDAGALAIINEIAPLLPKGSGFGQQGCPGTDPKLPSGVVEFGDTCNHLHTEVPRGYK